MTGVVVRPGRAPSHRLPRLLACIPHSHMTDLREHERQHGPSPLSAYPQPSRLIDIVEASGLTGRGGAGFPTGRKMRSVATAPGPAAVVANGAEGEPASHKDRLLLTRFPHLVLDGITLAAWAVGAREAYLCVHGGERGLLELLGAAVAQRRAAGADPVPVQVTAIPGRYVSSEQSSIVQYLNGGLGKPTFAPPRPHERGVKGRPTLVNNVETLAQVALIARYGDRWFREAGLASAAGSMLVTAGGAVMRPGVYEIEMGTPLGQVVALAGGPSEQINALLVGGYFGAWLPAPLAWRAPMTHASLRSLGGGLGAGVVLALPTASCALAETARVVRYLSRETAGQCGPCVHGLPELADAVADLAYHGGRGEAISAISRLIPLIEGRGACRHPDGATQLVRSVLRVFVADARRHDQHGPCPGVRRRPLLPVPGDVEKEWEATDVESDWEEEARDVEWDWEAKDAEWDWKAKDAEWEWDAGDTESERGGRWATG